MPDRLLLASLTGLAVAGLAVALWRCRPAITRWRRDARRRRERWETWGWETLSAAADARDAARAALAGIEAIRRQLEAVRADIVRTRGE